MLFDRSGIKVGRRWQTYDLI